MNLPIVPYSPTKTNELPGELANYSCGFECQDLTSRNESGSPLRLDKSPETWLLHDLENCNRSQNTLMASLVTIKATLPRSFNLENVGNCPTLELLRSRLGCSSIRIRLQRQSFCLLTVDMLCLP